MNKKKVWISVVVVVLIVFGIAGYKIQDQKKWEPVNECVEKFLDAYNQNNKEMKNYILDEGDSNLGACMTYSRFLQDQVTYDIKGHYREHENYIVEADITTVDMPQVMNGHESLYQNISTMNYLDNNIKDFRAIKDKPTKTMHAKFHVEKFEGAYYIVLDTETLDVLSGGFHTYQPYK